MTTITLTPDLEEAVAAEAQRRGTTPQLLAVNSLRTLFLPERTPDEGVPPGETAQEFLQDFIGVIHSSEHVPGGARFSEQTGRKFAEILKRKDGESGE